MRAKYWIRLDDLCPGMNWRGWDEIEAILIENNIQPLLAVVPDNQDRDLQVEPANLSFWKRVRRWQDWGWTIGLHGYQHRYVTSDPGILGLNNRSEFAGLPMKEQEKKIRKAIEIFQREGVHPQVWAAPAHSFDAATVALLQQAGIRIISDGFFLFPHLDDSGMLWIPQQMWRFRPMPFGVWTVCLHPNRWTQEEISRFRSQVRLYRDSLVNLDRLKRDYGKRRPSWTDPWVARALLASIRIKRKFSKSC